MFAVRAPKVCRPAVGVFLCVFVVVIMCGVYVNTYAVVSINHEIYIQLQTHARARTHARTGDTNDGHNTSDFRGFIS